MLKNFLLALMRIGRRLFRNTPIQRLPVVTFVYKQIAKKTFGVEPVLIDFRNTKILYPGGDYTTLPTLVEGSYESTEFDVLEKILSSLKAPIVAIDIGANVGIWTMVLAKHDMVEKVVSFEPSHENLSFLYKNIELNGVSDKVVVVESAVSSMNGTMGFDDSGNGATKRLDPTEGATIVSVVSLDSYLDGKEVGLIKVDVEGFEPDVMVGAQKTVETFRPTLFIEFSKPQVERAGRSWGGVGQSLVDLYGGLFVLEDSGSRSLTDFSVLENDARLLNLLFVQSDGEQIL